MEKKHTVEDLKAMQSWDLGIKIQVTQTRIMEWYIRNKGKCYISFSGGKDSTVLLDLARRIYPDIEAVFVDTGLEYPELKEFVKTKENVTILRPEMNFRQVIKKYGYPMISKTVSHAVSVAKRNPNGALKRNLFDPNKKGQFAMHKWEYLIDAPFNIDSRCCDVMKKKPAQKYSRETGKYPILATMACESKIRQTQWLKHSCNAFDITHPSSQPMSFWTEQDVLEYLKTYNVPYASVYGEIKQDENGKYYTTGCHRTGCVFCGFGCHLEKEPNRFQQLKETHPKLYEYCMKDWQENGLGMKDVLEFLKIKYD